MRTFVRCGQLFSGREDDARQGEILVFDQQGVIEYAGAEAGSPRRARSDQVLDYSGGFVMPGLIDVHTHLAYGNAKSEE
ncbi:MAG TPA: amidohydrolase family protein, partial [Stellaceae bacterium]|nr:amidohydrolase family protein [Stellaceae bacterium]